MVMRASEKTMFPKALAECAMRTASTAGGWKREGSLLCCGH